jgi:hypothetical protein
MRAEVLMNIRGNFQSITHQLMWGLAIVCGIRRILGVTSAPILCSYPLLAGHTDVLFITSVLTLSLPN